MYFEFTGSVCLLVTIVGVSAFIEKPPEGTDLKDPESSNKYFMYGHRRILCQHCFTHIFGLLVGLFEWPVCAMI